MYKNLELINYIKKKELKHIAIIMDGNGRWALNKGKPRHFGHKKGLIPVMYAINTAIFYKIKVLTLYVFSSENFKRPKKEISYLMNLLVYSLKKKYIV